MNLIAVVLDAAGLEADFADRTNGHKIERENAGNVLRVDHFAGAQGDVARAAAVESGAGEPPALKHVQTGRTLAEQQRLTGAVGDRSNVDASFVNEVVVDQNAALVRGLAAGIEQVVAANAVDA